MAARIPSARLEEPGSGTCGTWICCVSVTGGRLLRGFVRDARHFEIHGDFLKRPNAHQAPAGDGHGFYKRRFSRVRRPNLADVGSEDLLEALLGFSVDRNGGGEESMGEGVPGRREFACGREGAFGAGSVGSGGFNLT